MMVTNEGKRRIGDQQLGVLFDGGKVRCRREWRGVKDTLYDYGRWLYILSLLAKFIVKPRNIKAMFRYRWMSNYLAVPHMVDKFTMGLRDEALRIVLAPRGETLTTAVARDLARQEHLLLLCGHYEGIDERAMAQMDR